MLKLKELYCELDKIAPFRLSEKCIQDGEYDNSGIIINHHDQVNKILFSLDLSVESAKRAKRLGADTIVTHHPAIYYPIKSLSKDDFVTAPVLYASNYGINVISLHLNLDVSEKGIDYHLCRALGAESYKILHNADEINGYGKEFSVTEQPLSEYVKCVKKVLGTQKVFVYGKKTDKVKKVASFCGAGYSFALEAIREGRTDADLIVSSDMPHHVIKELVEAGKKVLSVSHYAAEQYGFFNFYNQVSNNIKEKAETIYFLDKRFM